MAVDNRVGAFSWSGVAIHGGRVNVCCSSFDVFVRSS